MREEDKQTVYACIDGLKKAKLSVICISKEGNDCYSAEICYLYNRDRIIIANCWTNEKK